MSWSTAAPTCFTHVGLRNMTVTPILWLLNCLCVICAIHLLTYNRTCRGNATGVPRQKAFSSKASGWYYDSLVYFLNMPLCYQHSASFNMSRYKHFTKIKLPILFWTHWISKKTIPGQCNVIVTTFSMWMY